MAKMRVSKIPMMLEADFGARIDEAFEDKFGVKLRTVFSIPIMQIVSVRDDNEPMTRKQHAWVSGYSAGYADAVRLVTEYSTR